MSGESVDKQEKAAVVAEQQPRTKEPDYKRLFEETKEETLERKEKIKVLNTEKAELEARLKALEDAAKQAQEQKLKQNEDYKGIIELKDKELNDLKSQYEPTVKELETLRELKNQVETREKTKRGNLLNAVKSVSEKQKNNSFIAIAEALPNDKLELYLRSISIQRQVPQQEKQALPVYSNRPSPSPRPAGEAINSMSIFEQQKLYEKDNGKYQQFINQRKGFKK